MDIEKPVEIGKLTMTEAVEVSKALRARWGLRMKDQGADDGDLVSDFMVPLLSRAGAALEPAEDYLADVRRRLAGRAAA